MTTENAKARDRLIALLNSYSPWDEIEAGHRLDTLSWLQTDCAPFERNIVEPGHAVGSAFIYDPKKRLLALIHHSKLGRWLQPGGHAEPGEDNPLQVAIREATEELGVPAATGEALFIDLDVHRIPPSTKQASHLHFDFRFLLPMQIVELHAASDANNAKWFSLEKLQIIAMKASDSGLNRVIEKLRRLP